MVVSISGCSGKGSTSGDNAKAASPASDGNYQGDNSFTYMINGKRVAIKDYLTDGNGKNQMVLFLNKVGKSAGTGMVRINVTNELTQEVFNFTVAASGTTSISHYTPSLSNFADPKSPGADYMSHQYKNYYGDAVTVTITQITATRVTGTFSGKFLSGDKSPLPLDITDGSFDLEFTKDGEK